MKKRFLLSILLIAAVCGIAQEELVVLPDRPGNSWGAYVMYHQKCGWDNGFALERLDDNGRSYTLSSVFRYGLFENIELRIGTDFLLNETMQPMNRQMGVAPVTIGTKIKCYEGEGWLPSIGLLAQIQSARAGSSEFLPSQPAPSLYLIFENAVNDWFYVYYNAGLEWDGETATPTTFLSLYLGFDLTERLGTFVETYNYLHPEGNQYLTEFGLYYLPSPRVQLDLEADLDFQQLGSYYSLGFGVSWMIN